MIFATEVGKLFRVAAGFDMSASTALSLKFAHSDGTTFTATDPAVTAPATPVVDPDLGSLNASEYFEYLTTGVDFTKGGTWTVCPTYEDGTPKKYFGTKAAFTVGDAC